jgi:bifunctional non-homologous end joining protein LigD
VAGKPAHKLEEYREKRDLDRTPEPTGGPPGRRKGKPRFVIQEHDARRLHWDLRLEHEGVLASWALPRGLPSDPRKNRLAVRTEDHPLEYLEFAGTIPEGSYGAGEMRIVDTGTYECEKWSEDKITFRLEGKEASGKFSVFRTSGTDWMIHRYEPEAGREPMPDRIDPMLATLACGLPGEEDAYGYEVKWDGMRAIAYCEGGSLRLVSRTGRDITDGFPDVKPLGRAIGMRGAILDGELAVLREDGRADFQRLQGRMNVSARRVTESLVRIAPVTYLIFDLLYWDGELLLDRPYEERRARLAELGLEGEAWRTPGHQRGEGQSFLTVAREHGLEGIIAKRLDSRYQPGRRTRDWLKIKNFRSQEIVIGGWTPGKGGRRGRIGALLAGYWKEEEDGLRLRYAGRVGTGFTEALLAELAEQLGPLETSKSPFTGRQPPCDSVFVEPRLVGEVEFAEWTRAGTLRAPVFKGLQPKKSAEEVRREEPEPAP